MASITFTFREEDLEFDLGNGLWWPQHMTGSAEISCPRNEVDGWILDSVCLEVAGKKTKRIDYKSDPELFQAFENALNRYDDQCGDISDMLNEAYWGDDEWRHDPEEPYTPIRI